MSLHVARLLLLAACAALGLAGASTLGLSPVAGLVVGVGAAGVAIALEAAVGRVPLRPLTWTSGGALGGLLAGLALGAALAPLTGEAAPVLRALTALIGGWLGGVVAARR